MHALIIGYTDRTSWSLPALLNRAGFSVDIVTAYRTFAKSRFVNEIFMIPTGQSAVDVSIGLLTKDLRNYDWIIITEDEILSEVLNTPITDALKLRLLPVLTTDNFLHVNSKVGLAKTLANYSVPAPPFRVVNDLTQALQAATNLSYPVLLKIDVSSGGKGVFECIDENELKKYAHLFDQEQVILLHKKIEGTELDLSALYRNGHLIHFSHSYVKKVESHFGPSVLREYTPIAQVDTVVFKELMLLGQALGADGFVNISCIESLDHKRYYFEADMRPNVWVEYPQFFNEDPAIAIRAWFKHGTFLMAENEPVSQAKRAPLLIPFFLRMPLWQLLTNRYRVWRYIPWQDYKVVMLLLLRKCCLACAQLSCRKYLPKKYRKIILQCLAID